MEVHTTNKILDTAMMEEIWGPSRMATPQINRPPDPPLAIAVNSKPAEDDLDKPTDAPDPRILHTLRTGRRRHPCRRGNCMTLQAPRRKRGRRVVTKLKTRDAIIRPYFKKR